MSPFSARKIDFEAAGNPLGPCAEGRGWGLPRAEEFLAPVATLPATARLAVWRASRLGVPPPPIRGELGGGPAVDGLANSTRGPALPQFPIACGPASCAGSRPQPLPSAQRSLVFQRWGWECLERMTRFE